MGLAKLFGPDTHKSLIRCLRRSVDSLASYTQACARGGNENDAASL